MKPMARTLGQHAEPAARLWMAVVLLSLLFSLAACSGEQAPQPEDAAAPIETTAVTQGANEPDPPT